MPFQSEKQRRFLHANHPEIAKRWEKEYATGGISNHFQRRPFKKGSYSRSYNPGAGGVVQHGPISTSGNGGGGGGHHPPVYTGPTPAEIAAAKAKAEAEKRALETAARKKYLADFKGTQKKKVKHTKKVKDWVTTHPIETTASSLVPLGTLKAKEYLGDVSKINQWANMGYGKGNPVPEKMLSSLKGSWVPNKTFEKLGYGPGSLKDWWNKTISPKHFQPAQKVINPAVKALAKGIGTIGKVGTGPIGWATTAALSTPSVIEALTKREDDATESSLFGIDLTKNVNMANGGILDINESEEIISDDGNEIALTDYNAAFDDPNDLSTGVKSLFRAKEGGNVRLGPHKATDLLVKKTSTGERPKYQPPGHRDSAPSSSGPSGPPGGGATSMGSGRDYSPAPTRAPDFVTGGGGTKTTPTDDRDGRSQALIDISKRPPKYKTVETHIPHTDQIVKTQIRDYYDPKGHQKRAPETKEERSLLDKIAWGIGIYVTGGALLGYDVPKSVLTTQKLLSKRSEINTALKYAKKLGLFKEEYTVDQLFEDQVEKMKANAKERKEKMDLYESLPKGHPERIALEIELEIGKKPDHLGDDGGSPELPQVIPIGEEVQEYEQLTPDAGGTLASIRSRQALNAQLQAKWAAEQEARDQLYMVANKGGLANLFRVKKQ